MRLFLICSLSLLLCACDKPEDNSSSEGPISFEIDSKSVLLPLTWIEPQILPPDYVQNGASSSIQAPTLVDLDNITLDNGVVINATPYLISELYVKKDSVTKYIKFDTPIPAYSQSEIDQRWSGSEVLNYTPLSNHLFEYESQNEDLIFHPNAVHFDAQQRNLGELIQIYDRFMINAPSTLSEVVQLMNQECYVNDYFSHCNQYNGTPEEYGLDTYFAKSVSGLTINLWADDDIWGLAERPSLELISSQRSESLRLWMSPSLLSNMESDNYSTSTDAWQGFVHEFYHNHGFEHESGWPSDHGVDDMFGEKVVNDYRNRIGNTLILPDILLNKEKVGFATYRIQLLSASDALSDIKLRLLSTQRLNARVKEVSSSEFLVEFEVLPTTDIYLSAYSEKSQQMSSTILNDFVKEVTSDTEIRSFDQNISMWLTTYDKVSVSIANGAYSSSFTLPSEGISKNKIVEFESTASYQSKVIHDGTSDILEKGDKLKYVYNGDYWDLISN